MEWGSFLDGNFHFKNLWFSFFAVVPSLLVPLCSPISAVRKSAIACLKFVKSQLSSIRTCPVTVLIDALIDNAEELSTDPEQLHRFVALYKSSGPLFGHFGMTLDVMED